MEGSPMQFSLSAEQRRLLDQMLDDADVAPVQDRVKPRMGPPDRAPLSFGQERLYIVDQINPGSPMYVGTGALRLRGELDTDVLRRCFTLLVRRHEVLRTALVESPETGEPEQRILPADAIHLELPVRKVNSSSLRTAVAEAASEAFDLACAPLLRPVLLEVADAPEREWVLVLSVHHVIVDGWSMSLLMGELGHAYTALIEGGEPRFGELPVQYADFAAWQRESLEQGRLEDQLEYWRRQLDGIPMVDIPTDRPRPARRSYAGDTVPLHLSPSVVAGLRALTDEAQATLFMALGTAWSIVLGRWSGERDVVVGTPVAGRRLAELENIVGFFVNTLPLRLRTAPDDTFRTLLEHTREVCVEAYAHQDLPFERIVADLPAERDVSGQTSLARHWLVLHNTRPPAFSAPGLEAELMPSLVGNVRCDLSVQLVPETDGGLDGWLEFSTELFDRATAERLATALTSVLASVATAPDRPVRTLPMMPEEEYDRMLRAFGSAPSVEPEHPGVVEWFEAQVDRAPEAVAVIADGAGETATYTQLDRRANRIAHLLLERGVGPEDRVGVCLERGTDLVASVLGVLKAGAVLLPLDPEQPTRRLQRLVEQGDPRVILTHPGDHPDFDGRTTLPLSADSLAGSPREGRPAIAVPPEHAVSLLYTSGSTGRPKGVLSTHGGLLNRLAGMQAAYRSGPTDRVLQKAPISFDVSMWELLLPLVTGGAVVAARPGGHRDLDYLHELIDRERVTVCHFVPSVLQEFTGGADTDHPQLRLLLSGGERLSQALAQEVLTRFPRTQLFNQYGPTEATIDVTAGQVVEPVPLNVPVGRPVPGAELHVLDESGLAQPVGVQGQLFIGGVQLARGYLDAPALTAERFVPHPLVPGARLYATGDRARRLADGTLEFLGRIDEQVKIGGVRIEPGEVEAALRLHPAVTDALVRAHTDEQGRTRLVGYVTTGRQDPPDDLESRLRELLGGLLPEAMVPAVLLSVPQWPLGDHGKIDVSALPRPDRDRASGSLYEAPRGPVEEKLAALCSELLQVPRIGRHDSFFALGGNSLLAIRAIARIRTEFGVRVKIGQFFGTADLASLGELVVQNQAEGGTAAAPAATIPRIDRTRG
ncbi:amino acid adenylation domain-containing protein [Streptomyces bottropensis]|uniref:non-ribosomal peptide synthetase n=1 Tax=Streptomyces bottropensis TaxID=42235 RepID=UPI0036AAE1CA